MIQIFPSEHLKTMEEIVCSSESNMLHAKMSEKVAQSHGIEAVAGAFNRERVLPMCSPKSAAHLLQ